MHIFNVHLTIIISCVVHIELTYLAPGTEKAFGEEKLESK